MTCTRYREAASARLDGEPLGTSATALDRHLATCSDCAAWLAAVSRAGRLLRVSASTPPDLSAAILDLTVLPVARLTRYRRTLRIGLAVLGFVQWALAMPGLLGDSLYMPMATHASHESAAWNLALAASFLAVAVKPARAVGALPILATFIAVLAVVSIPDLLSGSVEGARLASHVVIVVGLALVTLISRSERLLPPPVGRSTAGVAGVQDGGLPGLPGLRPDRGVA